MSSAKEMFVSRVRSSGDLAGAFEYADDTGWFYFYDLHCREGKRIVAALHVMSQAPDFSESEVEVRWNDAEDKVGLFIRGELWALFDEKGSSWGGNYQPEQRSPIAEEFASEFAMTDRS